MKASTRTDPHALHLVSALNADTHALLASEGRSADQENRFPLRSIAKLRELGFFSYGVPSSFGGRGGTASGFKLLTVEIAKSCLSTSIIWAMHTQQLFSLVAASFPDKGRVLTRQLAEAPLLASVTTERTGSDLLKPTTQAILSENKVLFERAAPIVTCGNQADCFLTTVLLRDHDQDLPALVLVERGDGQICSTGSWHAMGMRPTQSVPLRMHVRVPVERLVAAPMSSLMANVFIPFGHLAYGAAWYGAALGAYLSTLKILREQAAQNSRQLDSELLRNRLAECRMRLYFMACMLQAITSDIDSIVQQSPVLQSTSFSIAINNLKLGCSRLSFEVVDLLVEILGVSKGYTVSERTSIERVFRDLRAASLMYHDDRLRAVNGQLIFLEALAD